MNDHEFCIVDLWAAEAYITALEAGEATLLDLLDRGVKIHKWLLEKVKEKFPAECEKVGYDYAGAKQHVHSMNYGVKEDKMARESGLSVEVCSWIRSFYHGTFPGIQLRQNKLQNELLTKHMLTSLLGRKRIFFGPMNQDLLNQAYAWPSQSCIGELTVLAMLRIFYQGQLIHLVKTNNLTLPTRVEYIARMTEGFPALNTHDGLALRVAKGNRPQFESQLRNAFQIPLTANGLTRVIPIEIFWGDTFNATEDSNGTVYRFNLTDGVWE